MKKKLLYLMIFAVAIGGAAFTKAKAGKKFFLTVYYQKTFTTCVSGEIQKDCTIESTNTLCTWIFPYDGQQNCFHDATATFCLTPLYEW